VSSFLTAHQHKIGHSLPQTVIRRSFILSNNGKERSYLANTKTTIFSYLPGDSTTKIYSSNQV